MKLILANNQSDTFRAFYTDLQTRSAEPFDYSAYSSLLFQFEPTAEQAIMVRDMQTGRSLTEYDGVYINGYLSTYELAAATAICCDALGIAYVNRELRDAPSLSKLTSYAKLAAAGVSIPPTLAGAKQALVSALEADVAVSFPAILKRADADRGIDNYKVTSSEEVVSLLAPHDDRSLWILQQFIPNDGFYLVSFYDEKPKFSIYRTLEARPDGDAQKAHMFKPKGGANASLIELAELPAGLLDTCQRAITAMNRQVGSVDCLVDTDSGHVYVLEVNYNPQLVTIETLKDVRIQAFLDALQNDW